MATQHKLIAGAVVVAVLAGAGAVVAAVELSSSGPSTALRTSGSFGDGIGNYGLGGGRLGGRGLGGGLGPGGGNGRFHHGGGFGGGSFGGQGRFGAGVGAAAAYLGVSASTLQSELRGGQTMAAIAKTQGKTVDGLVAAMVDAQKKGLDGLVAAGRLTQAQEQQLESRMDARMRDTVEGGQRSGPSGGSLAPA